MKDIDKLFHDNLNQEFSFSNAEKQWIVVSKKLNKKRKLLMIFALFGTISFFIFIMLFLNHSTHSLKVSTNIIANQEVASIHENYNVINNQIMEKPLIDNSKVTSLKLAQEILPKKENLNSTNQQILNQYSDIDKPKYKNLTRAPLIKTSEKYGNLYSSKVNEVEIRENQLNENNNSLSSFLKSNNLFSSDSTILNNHFYLEKANLNLIDIYSPINLYNPYREIKHSSVLKTKKSKQKNFSLSLGIMSEFVPTRFINEPWNINPAIGIKYNFSRFFAIELLSNHNRYNRIVSSEFEKYNINFESNVYDQKDLISAQVLSKSWEFDASLTLKLLKFKSLEWNIQPGIQLQNLYDQNIRYKIANVYQTSYEEEDISNSNIRLNDISLGTSISTKLNSHIGLQIRYAYYLPISINASNLIWVDRQKISILTQYNF